MTSPRQPFHPLEYVHQNFVMGRRAQVLASKLSDLLPPHARVLDVGCGDGVVAQLILKHRPDVQIEGVETQVRGETYIPVSTFDGVRLPFTDDQFDVVMFVDVLHHANRPVELLHEAKRVAGQSLLIKDHTRNGLLAGPTLRFMDDIGNRRHNVKVLANYWLERQWRETLDELGADIEVWLPKLHLYRWPASLLFDRSLHFLCRATVTPSSDGLPEPDGDFVSGVPTSSLGVVLDRHSSAC